MGELLLGAFAAVSVASALLVVTRRNPVYSALFLIVCFIAVAGISVQLDAPFLAGMHVLVYAGAIMVLFLFVILLLNLKPGELGGEHPAVARGIAALLAAAVFVVLALTFVADAPATGLAPPPGFGTVGEVGRHMFEKFLLPFELVSVLIMVSIFGAVVLARKKTKEGPAS